MSVENIAVSPAVLTDGEDRSAIADVKLLGHHDPLPWRRIPHERTAGEKSGLYVRGSKLHVIALRGDDRHTLLCDEP